MATQVTTPTTMPSAPTEALRPTLWQRLAPVRVVLITALNLSIFFLLWELIARSGWVSPLVLPSSRLRPVRS